jgi:hypothetical protein
VKIGEVLIMDWLSEMINFTTFFELVFNNKFIATFVLLMTSYMVKYVILRIINKRSILNKRLKINMVNNIFTIFLQY